MLYNKSKNTYFLVRCRNGSKTLIATDQNNSSDDLYLMGRGGQQVAFAHIKLNKQGKNRFRSP